MKEQAYYKWGDQGKPRESDNMFTFEFSDISQSIHKDGFWQSLM